MSTVGSKEKKWFVSPNNASNYYVTTDRDMICWLQNQSGLNILPCAYPPSAEVNPFSFLPPYIKFLSLYTTSTDSLFVFYEQEGKNRHLIHVKVFRREPVKELCDAKLVAPKRISSVYLHDAFLYYTFSNTTLQVTRPVFLHNINFM